MNRTRTSRTAQSGFSLIELLVGLALLTLLAVAISGAFDGSRSRAQSLISMMAELGSANARLKNDAGCYVSHPKGLLESADATAANYCGNRSLSSTWNGPYVSRFETDNGAVIASRVAEGVKVDFGVETIGAGAASRKVYHLVATGLPSDVAKQFMVECNGAADEVADFSASKKCVGSALGTDPVTVKMMFDITR